MKKPRQTTGPLTAMNTEAILDALRSSERLIKEALPKFNWRASALDANAIRLLNETPRKVAAAIELIKTSWVVITVTIGHRP